MQSTNKSYFQHGIDKLKSKKNYPLPAISSLKSRSRPKTKRLSSSSSSCGLPIVNTDLMTTYIISCAWNTNPVNSNTPPPVQPANVLVPTNWNNFFNDSAGNVPNLNLLMAMVKVCYNTIDYATTYDLLQMTQESTSSPSWCVYGYYFDPPSGYILSGFPSNGSTASNPGCGGGQVGIIGGGNTNNQGCVWLKLVTFDDITTVYEKLLSYKTVLGNGSTVQVSSTIAYVVPPIRNCKILMTSVAVPNVGIGQYITPTVEMPTGAQFGILNTQVVNFTDPKNPFKGYLQMTMQPDVTTQTISNDGMLTMYMGSGGDINIYTWNQPISINPPISNFFMEGCGIPPFPPDCFISSVEPIYNIYTNIQNNTTTQGVTWTLGFQEAGSTIVPTLNCQDNATGQFYSQLSGCEIKTTNMMSIYLILQDWFPAGEEIWWGPFIGPNSVNDLWQVVDSNGFIHIGGRSYVDSYCDCPDCSQTISCYLCEGIETVIGHDGCMFALDVIADLTDTPAEALEDLCNDLNDTSFCTQWTGCDSCS
jgi:hypothetical protein